MYENNNNISFEFAALYTAGPESLEGALLGQKAALNLWYVDTTPNSQKMFLDI